MKRFSKLGLRRQFLLGFLSLLLFAACGQNQNTTSNSKTLKVATEPAFPPFESQAKSGGLEGFDIDIMNAIGEVAGFQVKFESLPFDGIIPALQARTVDAAISSITITAERQKTVSFSRPYFKAGLAIAVRAQTTNIADLNSLKNKKIAVQIGTTGAGTAKKISGATVRTFDSAPLALQELSNGNVDAVINDAPATLYAIKSGNLKGIKVVGQLLTEEFYAIALPKDSQNLDAINKGLEKLIENGTYAKIYQKWFDSSPPQLPEKPPI